MAYSVQADVERAAGGADALITLADLDDDGDLDVASLAATIDEADAWINSYVPRRYETPLSAPSPIIRRISAQETVYLLEEARQAVSTRSNERHEENRQYLEGIATGAIIPGVDPPPAKSSTVAPAAVADRSGVTGALTRTSLKGVW